MRATEVGDLFNAKAASWRQKYRAGGPLEVRLAAFEDRLARRLMPPAAVLDFGCGTGELAARLAQRGHRVTACDIAGKMLEEAQRAHPGARVRWVHLPPDWSRLPLEDATADAIVASSVFEYVDQLPAVLGECRRVLSPGGLLLFTVPNVRSPVRRVEAVLRPFAERALRCPLPAAASRLTRYARYLSLSTNRYPLERWRRILMDAGFSPVRDRLETPGPFGSHRSPLALLAFERTAA